MSLAAGGVASAPLPRERAAAGAGPDSGPAPGRAVRVLVVAAYPAVRAGLAALLAQDPAILPVEPLPFAQPDRMGRLVSVAGEQSLDAIVVDVAGAHDGSADDLADLYPGVPLVLLGADPATAGPGLGAGPVAYLAPDADAPALAAAVRGVTLGLSVLDPALLAVAGFHAHPEDRETVTGAVPLLGAETLTTREREVLRLVADGLPNKAIARELGISEHTAKFHVGSLLAKLGAASRTEAVTLATRRGLLTI